MRIDTKDSTKDSIASIKRLTPVESPESQASAAHLPIDGKPQQKDKESKLTQENSAKQKTKMDGKADSKEDGVELSDFLADKKAAVKQKMLNIIKQNIKIMNEQTPAGIEYGMRLMAEGLFTDFTGWYSVHCEMMGMDNFSLTAPIKEQIEKQKKMFTNLKSDEYLLKYINKMPIKNPSQNVPKVLRYTKELIAKSIEQSKAISEEYEKVYIEAAGLNISDDTIRQWGFEQARATIGESSQASNPLSRLVSTILESAAGPESKDSGPSSAKKKSSLLSQLGLFAFENFAPSGDVTTRINELVKLNTITPMLHKHEEWCNILVNSSSQLEGIKLIFARELEKLLNPIHGSENVCPIDAAKDYPHHKVIVFLNHATPYNIGYLRAVIKECTENLNPSFRSVGINFLKIASFCEEFALDENKYSTLKNLHRVIEKVKVKFDQMSESEVESAIKQDLEQAAEFMKGFGEEMSPSDCKFM